ncbi:MAG: iron-sulfur cluster assembly scaffold protein [Alphaproteobacteria bacterium]|nr:iron-sulfur cluster assembly scaffold protein [Alphaproteobacteria bacterium]
MSDPLYRKEILRLAADAHGAGQLDRADMAGAAYNPTCGDKIGVELALDADRRIVAMAHETKACVLTQASASILGERLKGASRANVEKLANAVAAMLIKNEPAPAPPFDPYTVFRGAVTHRNRHRCVLLPIEAVLDAFDKEPNQLP